METKYIDREMGYGGAELRSHFIREVAGIRGDGLIAFTGRCDVPSGNLVDLEDREAGSFIAARSMLHFVGEHFQCPLLEGNVRLRLLVSIVADAIAEIVAAAAVNRRGDDLFVGKRKLSVAICTVSPVSTVFHLGVNIDPAGAPVPAVGLAELGVDARMLAENVLGIYAGECESLARAIRKVKGVP